MCFRYFVPPPPPIPHTLPHPLLHPLPPYSPGEHTALWPNSTCIKMTPNRHLMNLLGWKSAQPLALWQQPPSGSRVQQQALDDYLCPLPNFMKANLQNTCTWWSDVYQHNRGHRIYCTFILWPQWTSVHRKLPRFLLKDLKRSPPPSSPLNTLYKEERPPQHFPPRRSGCKSLHGHRRRRRARCPAATRQFPKAFTPTCWMSQCFAWQP